MKELDKGIETVLEKIRGNRTKLGCSFILAKTFIALASDCFFRIQLHLMLNIVNCCIMIFQRCENLNVQNK